MQGTQKLTKHSFLKSVYQYTGFLKGIEAAKNTALSMQYDLQTFTGYLLKEGFKVEEKTLAELPVALVEGYGDYLKVQGLKANTRRRALATLRRFFAYHQKRQKLDIDFAGLVEHAPKLERVPETIDLAEVKQAIDLARAENLSDTRDLLILEILATEGLNISEICALTWLDFTQDSDASKGMNLRIKGRHERTIRLSPSLSQKLMAYKERIANHRFHETVNASPTAVAQPSELSGWIFFRLTKDLQAKRPLSERACEHSISHAQQFLGLTKVHTPRVFRHSVVLKWFKEGWTEDEIQERLGLRTKYAFRVFAPILSAKAEAEAKNDTTAREE